MQDFFNTTTDFLSFDMNTFVLSLATGIAMVLVFVLKAFFAFARRLARKTSTDVDDKIVDKAEAIFKEKSRDI